MAQDIPQLIAAARGFLTSQAYGSEERTTLNAIVDALETARGTTADLRHREVQALHAAISNKSWQAVETAANAIRGKIDAAVIAANTIIQGEA